MRLFLSFITQYIAKDELDTSRLLLMNDLFSYVLVRDGSAADRLSAHFLVEGQGAGERRSLMVNVPDNYVGATVENLILALKRTTFYSFDGGKRSKTIVRQEVPDHVWSRLAGRTTFAEMILKGEIPAEGLAIKGGAARTIGRSLAGSFNRLWRLARSGHAPDKAKVLNDWLGSQRAWIVQHVEKDSAHQIIIERKDDGLLIVVRGEEPSPAAWDQVLLASSMANNGTLVLFLDEFGGFRKTDDVGLSGRTRALFCELRGVNGSLTFGAENNPRWTEEKDPDKKDRYVDALRWFAENGRGLQASLIPSPDDIKATVDRKYRTFAKLYHPDKDPKNRELFKEAADHYNIVRGLAP